MTSKIRFKTSINHINYELELIPDPEFKEPQGHYLKELTKSSQTDQTENVDLDEDELESDYLTYQLIITATKDGVDFKFYLYGLYIEEGSPDIALELEEILEQQSIFELVETKVKLALEIDEQAHPIPTWAKS